MVVKELEVLTLDGHHLPWCATGIKVGLSSCGIVQCLAAPVAEARPITDIVNHGGEIARACSIWFRTEILICENYVPTFDQWQIFGIWWIRIHRSMNFALVIKIATYIMYNSSQCMTWYSQCLWYTDWVSSFFRKFTSKNDGCIDVSVLKSWKNFVSFRSHS